MSSTRRNDVTRAALLAALAIGAATGPGCGGDTEDGPPTVAAESAALPEEGETSDDSAADTPVRESVRDDVPEATARGASGAGEPAGPVTDEGAAPDEQPVESVADAPVAPRSTPDVLPEPPDVVDAEAATAVPPAPTISLDVAAALSAARTLRTSGDRMGAVRALRSAEGTLGDDPTLRLEAAWCFFEMAEEAFRRDADKFLVKGSIADAHLRLDQAARMHADLPTSAVLLAKILRYEEDPKRARSVLTDHLAQFPGDRGAHIELGDMAKNVRDWATADSQFTKAALLDPTDGRSRLEATIAKQWLTAEGGASYTKAQFHAGYRTAARLLPEEDDPIRLIVGLYPNSRADRLAALADIIGDRPQAVWARVWQSYVLRQGDDGDAQAALDVLDEARRIDPANTAVLVNRGEALVQLERWSDAVIAYTEALETGEPGTLEVASNALDRLVHVGAQSRTLPIAERDRAYDAVCAANPRTGRFGNNAGLWYRDVGHDYEKSLKYYLHSVTAQPDDQDYINDTALIYLFHLRDRKEKSLPMFLEVLALVEERGQEPVRGYWDALENLCKYYFETGEYEKVLVCAEKRADGRANVNGRAYPSLRAAQFANQARRKLAE